MPICSYAQAHIYAHKVWTGSWNINGQKPPSRDAVLSWVDASADVCAVGIQELVELSATAILGGLAGTTALAR